jgi:PAP2 superfamily
MMQYRDLLVLGALLAGAPTETASANVITDWDEIAVGTVQPIGAPPPINPGLFFRAMAMTHLAMFNAVDAIDPRYQPYKFQSKAAPDTSQEAAAASAAANVLVALVPKSDVRAKLTGYLAALPDSEAKDRGVKLGQEVAAKMLELRADDGSKTPNAYRPVTQPGVYVPTAVTIGWESITMTPFAMTSPSQFRPGPPPDLKSAEWAKDYNEIKELGDKNSPKRTARQTEDARFWVTTGPLSTHALERQIVIGKNMSVLDSSRFMAMISVAEADAIQSVYEAKYHYQFWRPITAIRNGDIDDNPETERMPTWEPIDVTPPHPEYPCAHCIVSTAVATVIEAMIGSGDIPEVAITMPSAPGVTHRFTNLSAFTEEVASARIYAGFHYRNSTVVGRNMGKEIGSYVVRTVMRPLN